MPTDPSPGSVTSILSISPTCRISNQERVPGSGTTAVGSSGPAAYAAATLRAASRTPRERARTLIDTLEMPSTSSPTWNASAMCLPANCSWKPGLLRKSPMLLRYDS